MNAESMISEVHVLHSVHFVLKQNENAKSKVLLLEVQVLVQESSKILVREVEQTYMTEVQAENNEKFHCCKECILGENKSIEK